MSNPLELAHTNLGFDGDSLEPLLAEDLLENYLDHLAVHLVGRVSIQARIRLKEEARFHIERLASHYQMEGLSEEEAMQKALQRYGTPLKVSHEFIESSFEGSNQKAIFKSIKKSHFVAFTLFGLVQLIFVAVLQVKVFWPNGAAYSLPISPGDARQLLPDPLPLPQSGLEFLWLYAYPFIAPVVAGWVAGRLIPVGAAKAVFTSIMPIVIYSFVVGALTLPQTTGVLYALLQVVWWMPAGSAAAWIASELEGRRRAIQEESEI